jgi:hypothetical protein
MNDPTRQTDVAQRLSKQVAGRRQQIEKGLCHRPESCEYQEDVGDCC